jgi:hypothetical protein
VTGDARWILAKEHEDEVVGDKKEQPNNQPDRPRKEHKEDRQEEKQSTPVHRCTKFTESNATNIRLFYYLIIVWHKRWSMFEREDDDEIVK